MCSGQGYRLQRLFGLWWQSGGDSVSEMRQQQATRRGQHLLWGIVVLLSSWLLQFDDFTHQDALVKPDRDQLDAHEVISVNQPLGIRNRRVL